MKPAMVVYRKNPISIAVPLPLEATDKDWARENSIRWPLFVAAPVVGETAHWWGDRCQ